MGAGFSKVRWRRGSGSFGRLKHLPFAWARVPYQNGFIAPSAAHALREYIPVDPVKREDNAEGEAKSSLGS